ncbi:MAG: hypothetical protein ACXWDN_20015, partial [Limisphaerales bacterium]
MAGFLGVSVVLAELASATTNSQPAIGQIPATTPIVAAPSPESDATPAAPEETVVESAPVSQPRSLAYGVNEVVKMYRGGISTDVLLTYIETSSFPYQLSSKEILYLNKVGVPSEIVNALVGVATNTWKARRRMVNPISGEVGEEMKRVHADIERIQRCL